MVTASVTVPEAMYYWYCVHTRQWRMKSVSALIRLAMREYAAKFTEKPLPVTTKISPDGHAYFSTGVPRNRQQYLLTMGKVAGLAETAPQIIKKHQAGVKTGAQNTKRRDEKDERARKLIERHDSSDPEAEPLVKYLARKMSETER